jgi:hypothetical protein
LWKESGDKGFDRLMERGKEKGKMAPAETDFFSATRCTHKPGYPVKRAPSPLFSNDPFTWGFGLQCDMHPLNDNARLYCVADDNLSVSYYLPAFQTAMAGKPSFSALAHQQFLRQTMRTPHDIRLLKPLSYRYRWHKFILMFTCHEAIEKTRPHDMRQTAMAK